MLSYRGNKTFTNIKGFLQAVGVKKFFNVRKSLLTVDGTLVTITRFEFTHNNTFYFAACEPETDIFEIDTKPIKNIT